MLVVALGTNPPHRNAKRPVLLTCIMLVPIVVSMLLSGCGEASVRVLHAPAPLPANVTVPYTISVGNTDDDGLAALNGRDGSDAWHAAVGEPSLMFAPVMVNGVIYTEGGNRQPGQSSLVAVRARDGRVLWQFRTPGWDFGMATDGVTVLVALGTHGLDALDAATGALRWHRDDPAMPALLYVKDGVAIATITDAQGGNAHWVVYQEEDGTPRWQLPDGLPVSINHISINHTAIYTATNNTVLAYAPLTGKELWHSEAAGTIVAVNEQTVLLSDNLSETQTVTSLDAVTGHLLWTVPEALFGAFGIAQTSTLIYGAADDEVIALRASDGTEWWRSTFPGYNVVQVTEQQGVVFAVLTGGGGRHDPPRVVALSSTVGSEYWMREISGIGLLVNDLQM